MARKANGGDENKAAKAPAKPRRRTVKASEPQVAAAHDMNGAASQVAAGGPKSPSMAEVQRRAYELFLQRGGRHGSDKDDWFEAERQLQRQM